MSRKWCSSNYNYKVSHIWHAAYIIHHLWTQCSAQWSYLLEKTSAKSPKTAGRRHRDRYSWLIRRDRETTADVRRDPVLCNKALYCASENKHNHKERQFCISCAGSPCINFNNWPVWAPLQLHHTSSDVLFPADAWQTPKQKRTCDYLPKMLPINLSRKLFSILSGSAFSGGGGRNRKIAQGSPTGAGGRF